ncbi:TlpA family protein disulfide reductase [Actinokineospora iranica]|nr:TlpA disulfide reductase family protein [Actinokineospora iranica]
MRALLAAIAALALALTGCATGENTNSSEFVFVSPGGKTEIFYDGPDRKPLPDLSGSDLMDDTKRLSLTDYRGKVVILNVWGQWCAPCRTEAAQLQKIQETYPDRVQVLGINFRDNQREVPQDFVRDRGLTYPSIYDPSGRTLLVLKGYPRTVVPATFVIDKQGNVAAAYLRELLVEDLTPVIDRLSAE